MPRNGRRTYEKSTEGVERQFKDRVLAKYLGKSWKSLGQSDVDWACRDLSEAAEGGIRIGQWNDEDHWPTRFLDVNVEYSKLEKYFSGTFKINGRLVPVHYIIGNCVGIDPRTGRLLFGEVVETGHNYIKAGDIWVDEAVSTVIGVASSDEMQKYCVPKNRWLCTNKFKHQEEFAKIPYQAFTYINIDNGTIIPLPRHSRKQEDVTEWIEELKVKYPRGHKEVRYAGSPLCPCSSNGRAQPCEG